MEIKYKIFLTISSLLLFMSSAFAGWDTLNMPKGVSEISNEIYNLHMMILWLSLIHI